MQVLLMHPTEVTQVGPQPGTSPFRGVTVHLTPAVAVIIPRPFVHAVTDGAMVRMAAPIALPLVGVELGAAGRHVVRDRGCAGAPIGMVAHLEALLTRVLRVSQEV